MCHTSGLSQPRKPAAGYTTTTQLPVHNPDKDPPFKTTQNLWQAPCDWRWIWSRRQLFMLKSTLEKNKDQGVWHGVTVLWADVSEGVRSIRRHVAVQMKMIEEFSVFTLVTSSTRSLTHHPCSLHHLHILCWTTCTAVNLATYCTYSYIFLLFRARVPTSSVSHQIQFTRQNLQVFYIHPMYSSYCSLDWQLKQVESSSESDTFLFVCYLGANLCVFGERLTLQNLFRLFLSVQLQTKMFCEGLKW